ncbi:diguanylate cyclase/phosphodiesterase (GGDEF & EAL domains) with PAS/PAC sensor(s) [hydrothermal vent metagenome]|uniref:Diguanylate cyclase/phosphodiesterase (GGDEF & EAL domains) with PAS/PAC sensor(S) n=1 Tax=hydrothermal vent metagenome TaxID=652676 RepID=A0A3B0YTG1_9ZZZZ
MSKQTIKALHTSDINIDANSSADTGTGSGTNLYDLASVLIHESQHGFIVMDVEHNILVWNKQISQWSGINRTQAIGLTFAEVFPNIQQSKLYTAIEKRIHGLSVNSSRFHDVQPILPLCNMSGDLPHEIYITIVPDLHGGKFCVLEVIDTSRLHNLHNSLHTQTKEFDGLVRSAITNDTQLEALFDNPIFSILLIDQTGIIKKHNHCAENLFSIPANHWSEIHLSDLLLDENLQAIDDNPATINSSIAYFVPCNQSINQRHSTTKTATTNTPIPVRLCSTRISIGNNINHMLLIEDYQQQTLLHQRTDHAYKDITQAFDLVSDAIIKTDSHCIICSFNSKAEQLTACSAKNAIGKPLHEIILLTDTDTESPFYISEQWIETHEKKDAIKNLKVILSRRDHQQVAIELSVMPINYASQTSAQTTDSDGKELILVLRDNSVKQEYDRKLAWHNTHDSLTGLVNRSEFENRLEHLIRDVQNYQQHHVVLHLEVDQLKVINNTCGHDAGDALLREITAIIKNTLGSEDTLARLGGDEFGVLLHNKKTANAHKFAQNLNKTLYQYSFKWQQQVFHTSTSIGLVSINITSLDVKNALSNAQSACLLAKESGCNRVQVYATGHNNIVKQQHRMQWHNRIQTALDKHDLVLHAQLIAPSSKQQLPARLELLVRIVDQGKLVMPDNFIPAAEYYQIMPKIDQWVVDNCLGYYSQLPESVRIPININLSGQSIGDEVFLQFLIEKIKTYDIEPSLLCFEITETAAIFDLEAAKDFMKELAKMGCEFALDDFGSGLSSLSYLKNLPIDYLKIDGAFVKNIIGSHVDDEILQSINRIGHVMNIKTVAEYVETPEIQQRLEEIGIDYLQGFLIHKPVLLQDFFELKLQKTLKG